MTRFAADSTASASRSIRSGLSSKIPAAQVDPGEAGKPIAQLRLEDFHRCVKRLEARRVAIGVEQQARNLLEQTGRSIPPGGKPRERHAELGARPARIVALVGDQRMLGIDAQADLAGLVESRWRDGAIATGN